MNMHFFISFLCAQIIVPRVAQDQNLLEMVHPFIVHEREICKYIQYVSYYYRTDSFGVLARLQFLW